MRLPFRTTVSGALISVALSGLLLVLIPVWAIDRLVNGIRTRRRSGSVRPIERVSASDLDMAAVMRRGEPVIIEGLASELDLRIAPDLDGFRAVAQEATNTFKVKVHRAHSPYFLYVGDYGAELERVETMTLDGFLDAMFEDECSADVCIYRLFGVGDLDGAVGKMIDDLAGALPEVAGRRPDRGASGIWIGSAGVVTPLHHDAWTGLLFQMTGSKRVLMFPPSERPNLYFTSPLAARERWSRLPARSDDADPEKYPRFGRAMRYEAQLHADEVLFIPPYWAHEIEALEPNISIPFRYAARPVDHLNPGFLRPAYEIFDHRFLEDRRAG
ncbi:MAG: cupin-like domain-containing protein [Acidimicrobiia bacterium]|nr:cupin-like domain-containing protein [Acidimicrobiia bacterium]